MSDLVGWLRGQLDLDEAHARKDLWCVERSSGLGQWNAHYGYNLPYSILQVGDEEVGRLTATIPGLPDGGEDQHAADAMLVSRMVRSAKARAERTLTDVEARRRVLDLHDRDHECSTYDHNGEVDNCSWVVGDNCGTLRLLALPYADRPGYQQGWKP